MDRFRRRRGWGVLADHLLLDDGALWVALEFRDRGGSERRAGRDLVLVCARSPAERNARRRAPRGTGSHRVEGTVPEPRPHAADRRLLHGQLFRIHFLLLALLLLRPNPPYG